MNNATPKRFLKSDTVAEFLKKRNAFASQCVISLFFILLILALMWSLNRYWRHTLQPRLYLVAETQAKILAESQSQSLQEVLATTKPVYLYDQVRDAINKMLIVEDPAIGERFIRGLSLQIDYTAVDVDEGSLDFTGGEQECTTCFVADVPLINRQGELLGLVHYLISDRYFSLLSKEMKSRLYTESSIALILVSIVWILVMIMFHRLHVAKKVVEASDRAKTLFMANVTHELRTPLNAILGYTQIYQQDADLMAQHGKGIDTINRSARHLLLMINDILEFAKANEESLELHPEEVDLQAMLNTIVEMTALRAKLKRLEFNYLVSDKLPRIVLVDEKRLRQILLNLLGNAAKFTSEGGINFSVERIPRGNDQAKARLRFSIEDTGIGIARNQLDSIFIPFHQIDNPITRAEGSGLGLTISQRLVQLMGSRLHVESQPGTGSRFWFELTLDCVSAAVPDIAAEENAKIHSEKPALHLPDKQFLDRLKEQLQRHNVLAIRELLDEIKDKEDCQAFIEEIQPYVQSYQFKQLAIWLDSL